MIAGLGLLHRRNVRVGAARLVSEPEKEFSVGTEQEQGGKSADLELHGQAFVAGLQIQRQFRLAGEVHENGHQLGVGVGPEGGR